MVTYPVPKDLKLLEAKLKILVNPALCSGCLCCQLACSLFHEGECNPTLARLYVFQDPLAGMDNNIEVCRQCLAPSCLYACPIPEAFTLDETTGARVIDGERCVGCGRCAEACPLSGKGSIINYHPGKNVYMKCDLCRDREGGPVCIEACVWGALKASKP